MVSAILVLHIRTYTINSNNNMTVRKNNCGKTLISDKYE